MQNAKRLLSEKSEQSRKTESSVSSFQVRDVRRILKRVSAPFPLVPLGAIESF